MVQKAIDIVPGFHQVFTKLQQVTLRGQSLSTLSNSGNGTALHMLVGSP
jgi:hypothetical protein